MQGDRLAQTQRVYFHQAACLFPMARGFFRWPCISAGPFSAVISIAIQQPVLLMIFTTERGYSHILSD